MDYSTGSVCIFPQRGVSEYYGGKQLMPRGCFIAPWSLSGGGCR